MAYEKPVLVLLASAEAAILGQDKFIGEGDNDLLVTPAAYEVDE